MIKPEPIAGEAYWQLGKHSRHLHTLKNQMTKLAEEVGEHVTAHEVLARCVSAKNEMHSIRGYSPNQWAFGSNPDRLCSTLTCHEHLPTMTTDDESFHENIKMMARARELFIHADSVRKLLRVSTLQSRKQQVFETGMLVYYYRKGKSFGAKIRGKWHGPARVLFVEKTTDDNRSRGGSIIWVGHGTVLLRCAPEQLQPVTKDVSSLDSEINGPFSPDEFMKDKHMYHDLMKDADQLNDVVCDEDEDANAWHQDPNNMRFQQDGELMDGPATRVRLNQKTRFESSDLDRISRNPPNPDSHGVPGSPSSECQGSSRKPADRGLQEHESRRAGADDTTSRSPSRNDVPRGMGDSDQVRDMVRRETPSTTAVDGISSLHRAQGRRARERSRSPKATHSSRRSRSKYRQAQEGEEEGEASSSSRHQASGVRGGGGHRMDGASERREEPSETGDPGAHAGSHQSDEHDAAHEHAPGANRAEQESVSERATKRDNATIDAGEDSQHKRLKTHFQKKQKVCEIILTVGPRDVHYDKQHGKSGSWVINTKTKRAAEVNIRDLNDHEHAQFREAKGKEIRSYMENAAVDICGCKGIDPKRIMGMRWILT